MPWKKKKKNTASLMPRRPCHLLDAWPGQDKTALNEMGKIHENEHFHEIKLLKICRKILFLRAFHCMK